MTVNCVSNASENSDQNAARGDETHDFSGIGKIDAILVPQRVLVRTVLRRRDELQHQLRNVGDVHVAPGAQALANVRRIPVLQRRPGEAR